MKFSKRDNWRKRDRETSDRHAGKTARQGRRLAAFANPVASLWNQTMAVATGVGAIITTATAIFAAGPAQGAEPPLNLACSIVLADSTPDSDAVKESLAKKGFHVTFVAIANSKEEYFQNVVPDKIGVIFSAKKRTLQLVLPKPGAPQHVVLASMSHYFKTGIPSSWKDLAAHFPHCDDMKKSRELIDFEAVLNRQALIGAARVQEHESYWPGWGKYFLETESLLTEPATPSLGNAQTKSTTLEKSYDELLEKTRLLSQPSIGFRDWIEKFRRLVIAEKVNQYCRDRANLSDFFDAKQPCANCVSQTLLMVSLIRDSKFPLLAPWRLAVRVYPDHIAPVLYDTSDKRILDLVYGTITQDKTATIYKPEYLVLSLLRGVQGRNPALTRNFAGALTDEFAKLNLILQKPDVGILPNLPSIANIATDLSSDGKRLYKFLSSAGPRFANQPIPEKAHIDFNQTAVAEAKSGNGARIGRLWDMVKGGVGGVAQMFSRETGSATQDRTVGTDLSEVEKQIQDLFNESERKKFGAVTADTKQQDLQRALETVLWGDNVEKSDRPFSYIFVARKRDRKKAAPALTQLRIGTGSTFVEEVLFDHDDQVREFNELSHASRRLAVANLILRAFEDAASSRHAVEIERAIVAISQGKQIDLKSLGPESRALRKEWRELYNIGTLIGRLPPRLQDELHKQLTSHDVPARLSRLSQSLQAALVEFNQAISANHRFIIDLLKADRQGRQALFGALTLICSEELEWWLHRKGSAIRRSQTPPQFLLLERMLFDPDYLYTVKPNANETKHLEKIHQVVAVVLKSRAENKPKSPEPREDGTQPPLKAMAEVQPTSVELISEEQANQVQFRPETARSNLKNALDAIKTAARPEVHLPAEFFIDLYKAQNDTKLRHPFVQLASMPLLREEFITAAAKEIQIEGEQEKSDSDIMYQASTKMRPILNTVFMLSPYLLIDLPIRDFGCANQDCTARFQESLARINQAPLSRIPSWTELSPVLLEDFVVLKSQVADLTVIENEIGVQPERIRRLTQNSEPSYRRLPQQFHFEFNGRLNSRTNIVALSSSVRIGEQTVTFLEWLHRSSQRPAAAPTPVDPTKPHDTPAPNVLTESPEIIKKVDLQYRQMYELRIGAKQRLPRILPLKDGHVLYANSFPSPDDLPAGSINEDRFSGDDIEQ